MPRSEFGAALEEARKGLDAEMSERANQRVRARLKGGPARARRVRRGRVAVVGSVVALAIVAAVGLRVQSRQESLGGFALVQRSADLAATTLPGGVTIASGHCVLRDEALGSAMQLSGPVTVRRLADGVEVAAGTVELDVDHDWPRAAPFHVRVSHGELEVLGTHFIVVQRALGGEVTLQRGSIQFRSDDGRVRLLTPGQALSWPLPPEAKQEPEPVTPPPPEPPVQPPARPTIGPIPIPIPKSRPAPATVELQAPFDAEALLDRIAALRSRGQFDEAVTALAEALREHHGTATDERLSFELGAILTRQLRDPPRACAHWRQHQQTFPKGRYETEVTQARAQLKCAE